MTEKSFNRLLDRLEDGLAIPFLGAGISQQARVRAGCDAPDDYRPSVEWLNRKLVELVLPELSDHEQRTHLAASVFVDALLHCPKAHRKRASGKIAANGHLGTYAESRSRFGDRSGNGPRDREAAVARLAKWARFDRKGAIDALRLAARNRLDILAEAALWSETAAKANGEAQVVKVCRALRIELFAELEPTPAHVYLAYLAREGLITELLTTNYDTCVEKAFRGTFHPDERKDRKARLSSETTQDGTGQIGRGEKRDEGAELVVIRLGGEYRRDGGRRWTNGRFRIPRPVFRVFKLNGCAARYREQMKKAEEEEERGEDESDKPRMPEERESAKLRRKAAEEIALTERQLQSFRGHNWARELFQDRARRKAFVFTGYGSEEPQIRHTALALMAEWERDDSEPCWDLPNAPFMACYEQELSFTQYQIMRGYAEAHRCTECRDCTKCSKSRPQNCFTTKDANWFEPPPSESKLSADLFWKRVFQASFVRRVEHACRRPGPFLAWIQDHASLPAYALQGFLTWLRESSPKPWNVRWNLLAPEDEHSRPVEPLLLTKWLMAMRGRLTRWNDASKKSPSHPYLPLTEDPRLIVGTLFLVYLWLGPPNVDKKTPSNDNSQTKRPLFDCLGVRVQLPDRSSLYLVTDEWAENERLPNDSDQRLVRQVVVPSMARLKPQSRMNRVTETETPTPDGLAHQSDTRSSARTILVGRCIRLPAEELLRTGPGDKTNLRRAFAEYLPPARNAKLLPLPRPVLSKEVEL